jgi:release factor glutamine methyltransferase
MPTLRHILNDATTRLQRAGVYSPEADAAIIISTVLEITREDLQKRLDEIAVPENAEKIESAVQQREARVPIARIFGSTLYRGLNIKTGAGVFEPCIETETLLEHLHIIYETHPRPKRVLDIGTGTGCLLLSVLNEMPYVTGVGIDILPAALTLATENAAAHGLDSRAEFRHSNWFDNVPETFDLVICNLPFVPTKLIPTLVPEVCIHDPAVTIDGGHDGLEHYRLLSKKLPKLLNAGGICMFHVSMTFIEKAKRIFEQAGFTKVIIHRNHYGIPMCISVYGDSYVAAMGLKGWLKRLKI